LQPGQKLLDGIDVHGKAVAGGIAPWG
jgi:hypothetical protein